MVSCLLLNRICFTKMILIGGNCIAILLKFPVQDVSLMFIECMIKQNTDTCMLLKVWTNIYIYEITIILKQQGGDYYRFDFGY